MKILHQDWVSKWAVYSPHKIAVKEYETERSLTYGMLHRLGNRLAHQLTQFYDIKKGDRIAILAENCLEYVILFVAAQKTGCILVPMNYRLAGLEIDYLLNNATPKLVIGEQKFKSKLETAPSFHQIKQHWSIENLRLFCDSSIQKPEDENFKIIPVEEDDPIFILFTSGTTGFPKGALYTHKMLFWNSINTAISLIVNTESRTINCMPPFHTGGWNVLLTPFLHHGGFTCIMKQFDPAAVLTTLKKEAVTVFMGVPTMLKMMADLVNFEHSDFSSLHYMIVGGEPMPIPLIEKWHKKNVPIRQGFGMTEVGPNLTSLHQKDAIRKKGSIGRPNFYVDIKIVNDDGQEVPPQQTGELLLRGPMVTPGYWRNDAATKKAIKNHWFRTGDLVKQDEEGYLYIVDRIKNMYISGGENVYPAEVERVLLSHPAVEEAAVIGISDTKWGETGKAFIVKKHQHLLSQQEVITFCQSRLAKFKIPKKVDFCAELPKNDTGKINRKVLKEME